MPIALSAPANALTGRGLLLAGLVYAALFAWYSWPLGRAWSTAFAGAPHGDTNQYIWNVWNFHARAAPAGPPLAAHAHGLGAFCAVSE